MFLKSFVFITLSSESIRSRANTIITLIQLQPEMLEAFPVTCLEMLHYKKKVKLDGYLLAIFNLKRSKQYCRKQLLH